MHEVEHEIYAEGSYGRSRVFLTRVHFEAAVGQPPPRPQTLH